MLLFIQEVINLNIEEHLRELMLAKSGSIRAFSTDINLPYSTVRTILERGVMNAKVSNVFKICEGLDISPESLTDTEKSKIYDIHQAVIQLNEENQESTFSFIESKLNEQNHSNIIPLHNREVKAQEEDSAMVVAAHLDDDLTDIEMEEALQFVEFAKDYVKSKRNK